MVGRTSTRHQRSARALARSAMHFPAEQIIALYERHAHAWNRDRGRVLGVEKTWLDRFTALLPQNASILDLGCGSGEPIARYLIEHGFHVAGVDTSPTLISLCQKRFPKLEWHGARSMATRRSGE